MNKGQMMKLVYTEQELRNIDSAIPIEYWNKKNPEIQVDPAIHVMNYNGDNGCFGKLENMETVALERNIILYPNAIKVTATIKSYGGGYNTRDYDFNDEQAYQEWWDAHNSNHMLGKIIGIHKQESN